MSLSELVYVEHGLATNRPASPPGKRWGWFATDTGVLSIWDGSTWVDIASGGGAVDSVFGRTGTVVAATSDYAADQIDFTPAGTISATDVQAAIEEVASEATGGATFGTPAIVLGTAAAAGSTDEVIRRDSTIVAFDGTAPTTQAFGDSAATGSAAVAARRDHKHAMPAAPTTVSGNAGTATALQTARNIDGQSFDGTADITVIAPGTHAATSKTTPIDADELPLVDTAASNVLKKLTLTNLKAYLKTYFDTLYAATTGSAPIGTSELIYRYTVTGSDKASIDTGSDTPDAGSNVWTGGDLLEIFIYHRTDESVHDGNILVTLNNDTGSNYDRQLVYGNNTSAGASNLRAQAAWDLQTKGASADANFFAASRILIANYAGTVGYKIGNAQTDRLETAAAECETDVQTLGYRSTSAVTRLKVTPQTSAKKLKVGSQVLIYKRRSS